MLARHVSDLIGLSSGAFCTSCIRRLWYVVLLCVLLDTSRLDVSSSTRSSTTYQSLRIQLVQNAPDDGHFVYLVGLHIYYKMIHGPYSVMLRFIPLNKVDLKNQNIIKEDT